MLTARAKNFTNRESNTTPKKGGLMVTLKGSQIALKYCLTTETPRTQRKTYLLPNREMPIG